MPKRPDKSVLKKVKGLDPALSPATPELTATPELPTTPARPALPVTPVKSKVTATIDGAVAGRARAAVLLTPYEAGISSLSELVERAIDSYVSELEATYNGGNQFEVVKAGVIPQGRRVPN